jgi:transposase InsO family protein
MITKIACGDTITWEGDDYRVEALQGVNVRLRPLDGSPPVIVMANTLRIEGDGGSSPETPLAEPQLPRVTIDYEALCEVLDKDEARKVARIGETLSDLLLKNAGDSDAVTMRTLIADAAVQLDMGQSTLWRLYKRWRAEGTWGLVDRRKARLADPTRNLDPRIGKAIRDQAGIELADSTRSFAHFKRRIVERLKADYGDDAPDLPSDSTLRRAQAALTLGLLAQPADTRRNRASQPDKTFGHMTATMPGEVVMFDTERLDVLAYDPIADTTTAVELTIAMDVATRSVLAWRFTAVGTSATDASLMLADMLTPEPMRPGWEDAVRFTSLRMNTSRLVDIDSRLAAAATRPVIWPQTVVIDHGKIFVGKVFTAACARLGTSIQPARTGRPTDKAIVERAFGTIRTQFAEAIAGYKGRSVAHRGDNVEDIARWTIEEIEDFFAEYVVAVWQRRAHGGIVLAGENRLKLSPNDAYAEAIARTGWIGLPDDPGLYFELLPVEWRKIHHYGVEINGLTYDDTNSDRFLGDYRRATSPYPGGKWPFRVDPRNPLQVFFRTVDGTWHALRWTHAPDFLEPFADVTAAYVRRRLRETGGNPSDQDQVARALLDLQRRTDEPEAATAKDRRALVRARNRTRAALKDQARAGQPTDEPPTLTAVPDPVGDNDPDGDVIDLTGLEPYPTGLDPFPTLTSTAADDSEGAP